MTSSATDGAPTLQQRRSSTYLSQTMMTLAGRLIGQRMTDELAT
ncbi:MAG: hypothetical protein ACK5A0_15705 [Polaromonas sp.]